MMPQTGLQRDTRSTAGLHRIRIVLEEGKLKYIGEDDQRDATTTKVRPGDIVDWQCNEGNYSILFKDTTPCDDVAYHGKRGTPTRPARVVGANGTYRYAVTVIDQSGRPVPDDPVIIVDDSE